jgi:hypothetical protein
MVVVQLRATCQTVGGSAGVRLVTGLAGAGRLGMSRAGEVNVLEMLRRRLTRLIQTQAGRRPCSSW